MRTILFVLALLGATVGRGQIVLDWYGAAAPAATLLLDDYPNAAVAYSLRLLNSAYTGDCIIVRRASDNALDTIGFAGGVVDTATLKTFCASTNCFVRTWYDQSGNGRDATSTVSDLQQPPIVQSGVVLRHDGEVVIEAQNSNHRFVSTSVTFASGFVVAKVDASQGVNLIIGNLSNNLNFGGTASATEGIAVRSASTNIASTIDDTDEHLAAAHIAASTDELFVDGVSQATGSLATFSYTTWFRSSSGVFIGKIKEVVVYSTDQLSNNSGIQSNINNFYNTY
jgi:hypothetical protein